MNPAGTSPMCSRPRTRPPATPGTWWCCLATTWSPTPRRAALLRRPAYGHGDFVLDWDAAQRLPEHDLNVGKAAFVYSRPSPTAQVDIGVTFTQIRDDDTGMLVDATYAYAETPGAGGSFQFSVIKDAIATSAALETVSVRSRWLQTGAGRSDVKLTGGDLGAAQATANECWDHELPEHLPHQQLRRRRQDMGRGIRLRIHARRILRCPLMV